MYRLLPRLSNKKYYSIILKYDYRKGEPTMKIAGLITEYNPFHNGHLYHIQKAKELTDADYLIVMSARRWLSNVVLLLF